MGTNGTAGAQAIKAAGGLCLAQAPETAEFVGMPSSVIHAGYADQILEPSSMAAILLRYVQQPYVASHPQAAIQEPQALERERQPLNEIFTVLRSRTEHDFSGYKKPTALRRIQRRMGLLGLQALGNYATRLPLGLSKEIFETLSQKYRIFRRIGAGSHRYAQLPSFVARTIPGTHRAELTAAPQLTRGATLFALLRRHHSAQTRRAGT
jgi:hypothetical protein